MELGQHFHPGIVNVKMLTYSGISRAAKKMSTFNGFTIKTLGEFIDFITERNLHKMSFLGQNNACKGCRDFVCVEFYNSNLTATHSTDVVLCFLFSLFICLVPCNSSQVFIQLRNAEKISNIDIDNILFSVSITRVYDQDDQSKDKLIDQGMFYNYQRLVPNDFTNAYEETSSGSESSND
jgi:hypothetical protein